MLLTTSLFWGQAQAQEAIPQGSAIAPPDTIESSSLTGFDSFGRPFPLTPNGVRRVLDQGHHKLALILAEQALNRGSGAPVTALSWRELIARAQMALNRPSEALEMLESLPVGMIDQSSDLVLMMAQAQLAEGQFQQARGRFSHFLVENPKHPKAYIAQRGIGICELKLGSLDRARLQLGLYKERKDRPSPDAEWLVAMAELSLAQGELTQGRNWLKQLPKAARKTREARHIFYRMVRMQVEQAAKKAVTPKLLIDLETALAHNPGVAEGQEIRILHAKLFHQWATTPLTPTKKVTAAVKNLMERRCLLRETVMSNHGLEQAFYLQQLLKKELENPIGLTAPGGLLTPDGLALDGLTEPVRAAFAEAWMRQEQVDKAVALLGKERGPDSDLVRLRLMALGAAVEDLPLERVLERLTPSAANGEPNLLPRDLIEPLAEAFLYFTRGGREHEAGLLQAQLETRADHATVVRLLDYQKGLMFESLGDLEEALLHYVKLAFSKSQTSASDDRLLPESPKEAAARLLDQLGQVKESALLLGNQKGETNNP
ncbi:tetratricopeptide repeat protein [Magnetococcus sp. PR-3]|uniref:tetratricopeptide repeat protein n=1 Tax=Magnetococcus sp. PR-3 TaxID=3120355 RepID=UPI002FCE60DE